MQQTSKYQFNLVDATDDFSPEPLNQNAQKTETALTEMEETLAQVAAANRVVKLAQLSGGAAAQILTIDFSDIALGDYQSVELCLSGIRGSDQLYARVNGDAAANYSGPSNTSSRGSMLSVGGSSTTGQSPGHYHIRLTSSGEHLDMVSDWVSGGGQYDGIKCGTNYGRWWGGDLEDMQSMQLFSSNNAALAAGYQVYVYGVLK